MKLGSEVLLHRADVYVNTASEQAEFVYTQSSYVIVRAVASI